MPPQEVTLYYNVFDIKTRTYMTCIICGKEFWEKRSNRQKCCSHECSAIHQRRLCLANHHAKKNNPQKTSSKFQTLCTCPKCGKTHLVDGRVDRARRVYCAECEATVNRYLRYAG